jgi:hypothetical protein
VFFYSEAYEKQGSNNKNDTMKWNHSTKKEQKFEHRGKRKKYRKNKKDEENNEGHSFDNDDDDNSGLQIYVMYIMWN